MKLEYRSNPNRKPILLSTIVLTLKFFCRPVLAPGMPNVASTVLFLISCAGNRFKHGNRIVINKYKIGKIKRTIIVIFEI